MKDFNNIKTVEILRKNKLPIILKMIALTTLLLIIPLGETITKSLLNKAEDEFIITFVFWLVRIFFAVPFTIGIFRGFYNIHSKKDCFALCCFMNLKSYFTTVLIGVFCFVFIVFELMLLRLVYEVMVLIWYENIGLSIGYIVFEIIIIFFAVLRIIDALIKAYKFDIDKMYVGFLSALGKARYKNVVSNLFPCIGRLCLLIFIFPALYVLPFTFVRMSIRENKTDVK